MTAIRISLTNIQMAVGTPVSPTFHLMPIPLYRGKDLVMKVGGGAYYKFGDASVTVSVADNDGMGTTPPEYVGVPYGATHVIFMNVSGSTLGFGVTLASEV